MDVVSLCPLQALGFVWQARSGSFAQTVIVKATYVLQPGESPLAAEQDEVNEEDNHWDDDATRSVYAPSDRAPFKPKADVMLVGHAFAPGQQPVRSLTARMVVGEVDKSVEAWCDRGLRLRDGQIIEGTRFTKMPLRWERAAGGPETNNPVGMRFDAAPDTYGMLGIPNLQPPGILVSQPSDTFEPVCLAPIAARWPGRTLKLGRLARTFPAAGWEGRPLPEALDYAYYQAAPEDQQVNEIRANERIILEHLRPDHARLVTSLPGIRPRAIAERATGEREEVALIADTLWIDTDRGICTVVWRGRIGLRHTSEAGRIAVSLEQGAREAEAPDRAGREHEAEPIFAREFEETDGKDAGVMTLVQALEASTDASPVMPFVGGRGPSGTPASSAPALQGNDAALPFGREAGGVRPARAPKPPPPLSLATEGTISATMEIDENSGARPAPPAAPPPAPPAPIAPLSPTAPIAVAAHIAPLGAAHIAPIGPVASTALPTSHNLVISPPQMVTRPPVIEPLAPTVSASPWGAGAKEVAPAQTVGQVMSQAPTPKSMQAPPAQVPAGVDAEAAQSVDAVAAKRGWKPAGLRGENGPKGPPLSPNPVLGSAVAASDAAAAAMGRNQSGERAPAKALATPSASPPKAVIELLWYDPAAVPRIRRQPAWKEIIAQIKGKAFEDELSGDSPPEKRQENRDRRDVAGLLARGDAADMAEIHAALASAVTEDGTFVAPLVLVAGELEFPFDELETLKATMAALTPLASGDKRLKETLDTTEELLKTAWLKGASGIAEGLTAKLKEVFAQGSRMLPPRYLEGHTERMLLEQRAYQKRTVLGKACIRSLLNVPGAQGGVPVYLPEALAQELPSFQRFGVRMIGEARGKVDQYEVQDVAVRGVGVGRAIGVTMRRA